MSHPLSCLLVEISDDPNLGGAVGDAIDTGIKTEAGVEGASSAIGAAIGMSVPIPGLDVAIAAIAAAIAAISSFLAGATKCTFHPDAAVAASWLLLFRFCPGLIYSGVDTVTTESGPQKAARLVRYFRLIAGMVKPHHLGNNGLLYNPRNDGYKALPTDHNKTNPYIESAIDPEDHLTNPAIDEGIRKLVLKYWHLGHKCAAPEIPSLIHTPAQAKKALHVLRDPKFEKSGVLGWSQLTDAQTRAGLRIVVARVLWLAGERHHDAHLSKLLGGNITPSPHTKSHPHHPHLHHDAKIGEAPAQDPVTIKVVSDDKPSRLAWFGLGALGMIGSLVGLAAWQVRKEKLTKAQKEH